MDYQLSGYLSILFRCREKLFKKADDNFLSVFLHWNSIEKIILTSTTGASNHYLADKLAVVVIRSTDVLIYKF